ncbi:hypothetical protein GWK08_13200 [Leptobacterium flavescens]|uniref:Uncharacterized protein n=1 Tax=Leptobacterium flavescens TaxID=472055 RepID=A0A6P0UME2_9FLAO|nr:hypothetical protein [Leptobacterium flavescens]NER14404.1 hypothetical protein [Leptobacterium flavescens]
MTISNKNLVLSLGLPLAVILSSVFLSLSSLIKTYPELAIGITYDLTLFAPVLYLLLIRKKKIPKITAVPFFTFGILLSTVLLPEEQHYHLNLIKTYVFPLVLIAVLGFIAYNFYRIARIFMSHPERKKDSYIAIRESIEKVLEKPKLARIMATDYAMLYYAFFLWGKRSKSENSFTHYKENGSIAMLIGILAVIGIETYVVHVLLMKWSPVVAFILLVLSIYGGLQFLGHVKAILKRHSEIKKSKIHLKNGLFGDTIIDIDAIEKIEATSRDIEDENRKISKLATLGKLEPHNTVIYLSRPHKMEKIYGLSSEYDILLLQVDKREQFISRIKELKEL